MFSTTFLFSLILAQTSLSLSLSLSPFNWNISLYLRSTLSLTMVSLWFITLSTAPKRGNSRSAEAYPLGTQAAKKDLETHLGSRWLQQVMGVVYWFHSGIRLGFWSQWWAASRGWLGYCDLRFAIRLRDLSLIFCDLCLWRWLVVDYVCWGLVCNGWTVWLMGLVDFELALWGFALQWAGGRLRGSSWWVCGMACDRGGGFWSIPEVIGCHLWVIVSLLQTKTTTTTTIIIIIIIIIKIIKT